MTSFWVCGLAQTRAMLSVGSETLGVGVFEVIWLEKGGFSSFSGF